MRYREDRRSLFFVVFTLALLYLPFVLEIPLAIAPLWVFVTSLFCFSSAVVNHNHMHLPVFHDAVCNRIFNFALTLAKGSTATTVIVPHNMNHHVHSGGTKDWIRPTLAGKGLGVVRILRFFALASLKMARERRKSEAPKLSERLKSQLRVERWVLWLSIAVLLAIDPLGALVFVFIPWFVATFFLVSVNLLQHDGCESNRVESHSRNFTSPIGNYFFFNNGFHTAHHLYPNVHWSFLEEIHYDEVEGVLSSDLSEPSILGFLLKHYVLE